MFFNPIYCESVPHLLGLSGKEPAETLEESYLMHQELIGGARRLPYKRVSDRYIFVKN